MVIAYIQDEPGRLLSGRLNQAGRVGEDYHMDVTIEEQINQVCADVFPDFGRIDILANNAGITGAPSKPTYEMTVAEWDQVLGSMPGGVFLCTRHAVPYMKQSGGGSIVNISSVYGIVGGMDVPLPFLYHAAKGAVRLITQVRRHLLCY